MEVAQHDTSHDAPTPDPETAPEDTVPEATNPEATSPVDTGPVDTAAENTAPDGIGSQNTTPDDTAPPADATPEDATREDTLPPADRHAQIIEPDVTGPEDTVAQHATPEDGSAEPITPETAATETAATEPTTPEPTTPADTAPEDVAAEVADPAPTTPEPTTPAPTAGAAPPAPRPTPGGMRPRPAGRPAPSPVADAGSALREAVAFGRVDDAGTVFVRTAAGEREVGTWAPGEPELALAFFARRFATLESEVELAESRARAGALGADATVAVAARLAEQLAAAQVVGDLDGLSARIAELPELALERREQRKAERAAAAAEARAAKESVIAEAEQIAQSDTWRAGPDRLRELFDVWRVLPRLDKATDDELWHRFSAARTTFTRRRKAHYSELAEARATIKAAKQALIAEAEKLATSTDWGPTTAAQRDLMNRWKQVGSASKDDDDALWTRFHTIRQSFFDARAAHDEVRTSGEKENLAAKRAVLEEAEALLPVTDLKAARRAMRVLRERWEAAGHVARPSIGGLETRWKVVEEALKGAEKQEWRRVDPEARRRAEQTASQLRTSIAKLETEAAAAQGRGDSRAAAQAAEALAARRSWLVQAEKLLTESR